jgi:hypothetical protein
MHQSSSSSSTPLVCALHRISSCAQVRDLRGEGAWNLKDQGGPAPAPGEAFEPETRGWFRMNDSSVTPIRLEDVEATFQGGTSAYVPLVQRIFSARTNPNPNPSPNVFCFLRMRFDCISAGVHN